MTKKLLALILASLMALSLLAGCSEPAESEAPASDDTTSEAPADGGEEAPAEEMTLRWIITAGGGKQQDADMVAEEVNAQLAELVPGTQVAFDYWMPSEYKEKFDLAMAGGETIDIAWKGYMMTTSEYYQTGTYTDLTPFYEADAAMQDALPEMLIDGATVDGTLCYMPKYEMHHWYEGLHTPKAAYDAYFDVDAFNAANQDMIENSEYRFYNEAMYDVIENYMAAADAGGDLGSGYSPYVSVVDAGIGFIQGSSGLQNVAFPLDILVPMGDNAWDTTIINIYERPEVEAHFAQLAEWKDMGYMRNDLLTLENPRQYENTNVEGNLVWFHNYVNPEDPDGTGTLYYETMGTSRGWDADHTVMPIGTPVVGSASNDGIMIPFTAQDAQRSYDVLRLMFIEEGKQMRNTLVWGLEGTHYEFDENGRVVRLDGAGEQESDTYGVPTWGLGNVGMTWLTPVQAENTFEYYDQMVDAAAKSPTIGFSYIPGDFDAEMTNIRNVCAEHVPSFNAGDYTPEAYDAFLAALAETDIAAVQADIQAQFDAFLA